MDTTDQETGSSNETNQTKYLVLTCLKGVILKIKHVCAQMCSPLRLICFLLSAHISSFLMYRERLHFFLSVRRTRQLIFLRVRRADHFFRLSVQGADQLLFCVQENIYLLSVRGGNERHF